MDTPKTSHGKIKRKWLSLVVFVVLCLLVGGVSGFFNAAAIEGWYAGLQKPSWTPPNRVFGPVWTFLYVCIGIAGWLVWTSPPGSDRNCALRLWILQLLLNSIWTPLFFSLRLPAWAALDIVILWAAIGAFTVLGRRVSAWASLLFVPYWAWVSYASALNIAIWWLNRGGGA